MRQAENRRDRVLDAAQHLFLRSGFRGTTMEAIAAEAGIAKPTLYAEFPDKVAVFSAVLTRFFSELHQAFDSGLSGNGPVAQRIAEALTAKYLMLRNVLEASPHATELYGETRQAAPQLAALETAIAERIAAEIGTSQEPGEAIRLASILAGAADGVAKRSRDEATLKANLRFLVEKLLS